MQKDTLTYHQQGDIFIEEETFVDEDLFFDKYFSKEYSSKTLLFATDSTTLLPHTALELKHENISKQPEVYNWVFCLFLICFIFLAHITGKKKQIFQSEISELLTIKGRKSIFFEPTRNEWHGKLFLCFQTCLLLAIFLYKNITSTSEIVPDSPVKSIIIILLLTLFISVFFIIKRSMYHFVGWIFFDKQAVQSWTDSYFTIFAYSGIFLFTPVLLHFYVDALNNFCFYLILAYLILFEIFVIYKSIVLFFYKPSLLIHLFLYLCGQEIIPLLFLWKISGLYV